MAQAAHYSILVVDDDPLTLESTGLLLRSSGYRVDTSPTPEDAIQRVREGTTPYALCILDYRLGHRDGADVARELLGLDEDLYVLIHSGDSSREALNQSWKAGAVGFLEKGQPTEILLETVRNWCQKFEATHLTIPEFETMKDVSERARALGMIGRSRAIQEILERVTRYKTRKENVLIVGETGTGKERVARAFLQNPRQPFLAVNCAAYNGSSELMESELFGYVKGAFTGAGKDQKGVFEQAQQGTVFLDEIHTLSQKAQQKLLRVLQDKKVRPVGGSHEYPLDFRLIAAAKPEIDRGVEDGAFLPDFFERINVLRINIRPLRERLEDIEPLVAFFCEEYERETGEKKVFLFSTLHYLTRYNWPRNVRELQNMVRRLCVDSDGTKITPEHLDARFFAGGPVAHPLGSASIPVKDYLDNSLKEQATKAMSSGASQREIARRLGMPESSLRRALKRWSKQPAERPGL